MTTHDDVMTYVQRTAGYMTGHAVAIGLDLGDRLGLYRAMAGRGPLTPEQVGDRAGCIPRLVREWLDGQSAAGLINHDPGTDRYPLTDAAAAVLADDNSPVFLARGVQTISSLAIDMDRLVATYRGQADFGWVDHDDRMYTGVEWFFRNSYRAHLASSWIPAADGVEAVLQRGARVADVGCGHGASLVALAQRYPGRR